MFYDETAANGSQQRMNEKLIVNKRFKREHGRNKTDILENISDETNDIKNQ